MSYGIQVYNGYGKEIFNSNGSTDLIYLDRWKWSRTSSTSTTSNDPSALSATAWQDTNNSNGYSGVIWDSSTGTWGTSSSSFVDMRYADASETNVYSWLNTEKDPWNYTVSGDPTVYPFLHFRDFQFTWNGYTATINTSTHNRECQNVYWHTNWPTTKIYRCTTSSDMSVSPYAKTQSINTSHHTLQATVNNWRPKKYKIVTRINTGDSVGKREHNPFGAANIVPYGSGWKFDRPTGFQDLRTYSNETGTGFDKSGSCCSVIAGQDMKNYTWNTRPNSYGLEVYDDNDQLVIGDNTFAVQSLGVYYPTNGTYTIPSSATHFDWKEKNVKADSLSNNLETAQVTFSSLLGGTQTITPALNYYIGLHRSSSTQLKLLKHRTFQQVFSPDVISNSFNSPAFDFGVSCYRITQI